jgi:hypothetical protein
MEIMKRSVTFECNRRITRQIWGDISPLALGALRELTSEFLLSIGSGDLLLLDGRWYVTHTGLLRVARRNRCTGINVQPVPAFSDPSVQRWAFKATVYKSKTCKGFVGYGDADPSNVSPLVRGAEMRVAETRAVNRALRKAYGIGICSVEEIGSSVPSGAEKLPPRGVNGNGNGNGSGSGPKVRDRLCQIIRQHKLDAELVKAYALDYCGTPTLKDATREQIENFVCELAEWAEKDRNALLCQLNSYLPPRKAEKEGAA